jgi:iron complex outermembrane receptor protein
MKLVVRGRRYHRSLFSTLILISSSQVSAQDNPPLTEEAYWQDVPTVISVTRMSQPVIDSPVAVTVIDRRMIEASGAREIPELFRLVPGFIVGYHDGHTPSVSYHLAIDRYARQMQVLIDGRSVYTTAIGGIPWATLHITLDDIERIEVVRGPNSASYGANSFLGVINIITRHPVLDKGTSVKTNVGDEGVREVFVRHGGGSGKLDYRVTAGFIEDNGLPHRFDYKRTQLASLRADYSINSTDILTFEGGVGTGPRGVENRSNETHELSPDREKTVLNHHQQIKWERTLGAGESLSVQFYHIFQRNFETYTTEPLTLASSGGIDWVVDPIFVDFSRHTDRYDLEMQHNVNLADSLRAAWGLGLREDQVWGGENLMNNQDVHNNLKFGFMNMEWAATRAWLFNAGTMIEDYSTTGTDISPRIGTNYRFTPNQSVRLTYSKAVRTPSMFEYAANYNYGGSTSYYSGGTRVGAGPDVYNEEWVGTRQTKVEEIKSYELGYHCIAMNGKAEFDVKWYNDDLDNIIGLSNNTVNVPANDIDGMNQIFRNRDSYVEKGVELETKITFVDKSSLYFGYAYTNLDERVKDGNGNLITVRSSTRAPKNTFSLLYMMGFDPGYSAGIGYYFTDRVQGWETASGDHVRDQVRRLDVRVARDINLDHYDVELALAARNVLGSYEEMEVLRPRSNYPYLNMTDSSAYLTVKVSM